ncbi:HNH endonuclease [Funiculus sociatus GB2-A5]|uniref:HNH endonuclease n=1 Tax=Funiculus sociatus GB2-A5 TaxID=2933946 RepID=A0ABV0JK46_9CYAN|nr:MULTISPECIES: HNH endonuclease [Cyanophyceae]MBD1922219.1 HNH endonuclease [Microcoleus sp. FACHB-831]MBD2065615.1 HNH endonuclease [Trichocoleus sp. FACHB-6]
MNGTNPGQELRNFLKELYPHNYNNTDFNEVKFFISEIDSALIANGEFSKIVYESSINYMLRRFINTAEYLKRKYESDEFPAQKFVEELRRFITEATCIPKDKTEKLLALLQACLQSKGRKVKPPRKKRLLKEYQAKNELRCYICGKYLNEQESEIEHIWPRTMGGATEDFNLKISCSICNDKKQHYIDASDFHYEQICLVSDKSDENFSKEMKKEYRIAVWAKSDYSCTVCGEPASIVGTLNFGRINPDDSWHFLNTEAYCDEHTPE